MDKEVHNFIRNEQMLICENDRVYNFKTNLEKIFPHAYLLYRGLIFNIPVKKSAVISIQSHHLLGFDQ